MSAAVTGSALEALKTAWEDPDCAEVYADLDQAGRAVRDAAHVAVQAADSADLWAMVQLAVDYYEELEELQSWLGDPEVWGSGQALVEVTGRGPERFPGAGSPDLVGATA